MNRAASSFFIWEIIYTNYGILPLDTHTPRFSYTQDKF